MVTTIAIICGWMDRAQAKERERDKDEGNLEGVGWSGWVAFCFFVVVVVVAVVGK